MACHECLDSKALGFIPSFMRCWTCGSWCCRKDVSWCPGRIIHPTPSEELVNLSKESNFDSKLIVRSHSPKPGSCQSCIDSGYADEWISCSGRQSVLCPSSGDPLSQFCLGGHGVYCAECITRENVCACGEVWFCDTCSVDPASYPYIISCSRCGARYCTEEDGCEYCHFCCVCRRPGVCLGCQARDKGDVEGEDTSGEGSQPLNAYEPCLKCGLSICKECYSTGEDGVVQCSGCQSWMCAECANGELMERCGYCLHEDLEGMEQCSDVSTTGWADCNLIRTALSDSL
ncbi:hypothetical protein OG21DRAFT_145339 [Imleria badia]|nr:hypothetical protein OG21DRAFT_145339 [Imleria badia]